MDQSRSVLGTKIRIVHRFRSLRRRLKVDPAVGLVQAYLRLNSFFTVTEYPVVWQGKSGVRTLTDIDVLALRLPDAQHWVGSTSQQGEALDCDPILNVDPPSIQMIIGEVKEGKARLNPGATSQRVIESVIRRFGCCDENPAKVARTVMEKGSADTRLGSHPCRIRIVVFGGRGTHDSRGFQLIELSHVVQHVIECARRHSEVMRASPIKDDALGLMALLVKLDVRI
ncbi:MAG: hypothetical protein D8M22_09355 [Armatimonadetes bacterium]|nr:hypothetical protein [Armatimonadota bacterium]